MNHDMPYEEVELRIVLRDCLLASQTHVAQEIKVPDKTITAIVNRLLREEAIVATVWDKTIWLHGFTDKGRTVYCKDDGLDPYYTLPLS
ncbi:MAG: hypothetical protein IJG18_04475 [Kiritimatiellae bacterium]|nr:hypothetical protein [Kiritimatiellia bacterium]